MIEERVLIEVRSSDMFMVWDSEMRTHSSPTSRVNASSFPSNGVTFHLEVYIHVTRTRSLEEQAAPLTAGYSAP